MKTYLVPITVIEHGRAARVEANSPAEAQRKARAADWLDCTDPDRYTVKLGRGPVVLEGDK